MVHKEHFRAIYLQQFFPLYNTVENIIHAARLIHIVKQINTED